MRAQVSVIEVAGSSRSQMFFRIGILKNFAIFSKKACNFIKTRLQCRCFPVNITKLLKTVIFYRTHLVTVSDVGINSSINTNNEE